MASSTLVVYLALELGAPGLGVGISLVLVAPRIVGLLRLFVPPVIGRLVDRKRFCLGMYFVSALVLLGLPWVAAPGILPSPKASLAALVGCWCAYHLLEFFGLVAMLSWFADLVPGRVRGRFFGRRQRWMLVGQATAMLGAGLFCHFWQKVHPEMPRWIAYAAPAVLGACCMLSALVPLSKMPAVWRSQVNGRRLGIGEMLAPLVDLRFLGLLMFGCWFSFFNGLTQTVQQVFPAKILGLGLFPMLGMQTGMRVGQLGVSPWLGRLADRWGNKPLMLVCRPLVASALLFYFHAVPTEPWWIIGAWILWIAYAGINVAQPNLLLKMAPLQTNTAYIAVFQGFTDLSVAASTLIGGWLYDRHLQTVFQLSGAATFDLYQFAFLLGAVGRGCGVFVLLGVYEPKGQRS